jgi:hypothetical protein
MQSRSGAESISPNSSVFYPPNPYKPLGLAYSDWGKRWYEWLQSIVKEVNPAADRTGRNCALNQSGPVWFLAGTIGGMAKRTCSIPAGKDIFVSIINEMSSTAQYKKTDKDLVNCCSAVIDRVLHKEVIFDSQNLQGAELDPYRVKTDLFNTILPNNNLCGVQAGPTQVVCDGYWIMIKQEALTFGRHLLHSHGEQSDGFTTEVTYDLMIE